MHQHEDLINRFYSAFKNLDHETMASCYHKNVVFSDPVFKELKGWKASSMWRMLCERAKDFQLEFQDVSADDSKGQASWNARYLFSQTGLMVHNKIQARFQFRDGLIIEHVDEFDLRRWMGMALGTKGKLMGWLPPVRAAVASKAMKGLDIYLEKKSLSAKDFANG